MLLSALLIRSSVPSFGESNGLRAAKQQPKGQREHESIPRTSSESSHSTTSNREKRLQLTDRLDTCPRPESSKKIPSPWRQGTGSRGLVHHFLSFSKAGIQYLEAFVESNPVTSEEYLPRCYLLSGKNLSPPQSDIQRYHSLLHARVFPISSLHLYFRFHFLSPWFPGRLVFPDVPLWHLLILRSGKSLLA